MTALVQTLRRHFSLQEIDFIEFICESAMFVWNKRMQLIELGISTIAKAFAIITLIVVMLLSMIGGSIDLLCTFLK